MNAVIEFIAGLLLALRAPDESDAKAMKAWRQTVAGTLSAVIIVLGLSFCWAQGWLFGWSGVALASDVGALKQSVDSQLGDMRRKTDAIQLILIKNGIENAMRDGCTARQRQNQAALDMANSTLYGHDGSQGLIDQYRDLTGHGYEQKDCRALLISTSP